MSVIGLRVGPFELVESAWAPAAGAWYKGRRASTSTRQPNDVLVRLLAPDAAPAERAELQRWYDNLRAVEDARVPRPIAFYDGSGALVLEPVEGVPLSRLLDGRRHGEVQMTPSTLLDIAAELAECLQHAHHRGRFHGHLSAQNVVLCSDGGLVVFGFGAGPTTDPWPDWTPPERHHGHAATAATDQWCLGAIMASLVTGRSPWSDQEPGGDPDRIADPVEQQWPTLGRLLRRMLAAQPAHRHASLHPVRQEILALARRAGGTSDLRTLASSLHGAERPRDEDAIPAWFTAKTSEPAVHAATTRPDLAPYRREEPPPEPQSDPPSQHTDDIPTRIAPVLATVGTPLPDDALDVVQPQLDDGELPAARMSDTTAGRATIPPDPGRFEPEPDVAPAPKFEIDAHMQADVEPSEATVLFDSSDIEAMEAVLADEAIADMEPSEETVLVNPSDAARLLAEVQVDPTDPEGSFGGFPAAGPASTGAEWFHKTNAGAGQSAEASMDARVDPALISTEMREPAPVVVPNAPPHLDHEPAAIVRLAPWIVGGMLIAMLVWSFAQMV
jgi:serine/threonine protein kinase